MEDKLMRVWDHRRPERQQGG